ncbi:hypothetical protein Misp01_31390 [Microtetraspora sp. NBRC 13810]|uniref:serine/threonine-protein kinase n=1 Tax=Microtetraspora sp. NBRC 13810 TaxID=3030990 RepID=UPI0024A2E25E|nr:serine/threonine-protein kinase [Microtetraspora sp. NBRC 13810]GLW08009.1 hypothetical protein Misp01_31390 [Microtetraspora sp. NBRC 13810]
MVSPDSERLIAGRYRLLRKLGQGGMGVVWEGHDTLLDRTIAVKEVILPPGLPPIEHERQLLRTTREARTAARLNHPSIVAVYDVAEQDGRPWIVMELVEAQPLDEIVRETGPIPVRQLADIGRQVLSALRAAHEIGILHRDVKPGNILVTAEGRAVLTDFGIATLEGDSSLTQTGMVAGSPSFLAPERARGHASGPPSDLWSLGATLYAAVIGRSPFERSETMATLSALLTEDPDMMRVPRWLHPVIKGLLQRDPAERLTAEQADELLAELLVPEGRGGRRREGRTATTTAQNPEQSGGGRRRTMLIAAAAVVVAVGGTVGWITLGARGGPPAADAAVSAPPTAATAAATEAAPSATPTPTPTPTPTATKRPGVLRPWNSPKGWAISFPRGWKGSRDQGYTEWLRRDGGAHLGVEESREPGAEDPLSILGEQEQGIALYAQDIRTIRTGEVAVPGGKAAEWEFTWVMGELNRFPWARAGETYHEVRRVVVAGGTAYTLEWTAPEAEWNRQRKMIDRVFDSFTPAGG